MSKAQDLVDDFIHHAHLQERYKTAQGNKIIRYIRKLNKSIAEYLLKKRSIETKKDYARVTRWVKEQCSGFSEQLLGIITKDLAKQFRAEKEWMSGTLNLPKQPEEELAVKDIMFAAFNDVDTIETYIKSLAMRVYRIWDSQLRITYATGTGTKQAIETVMGAV